MLRSFLPPSLPPLSGNYTAAQEMVLEKKASSARFKFFIQQTIWAPGELKKEIEVRPSFPPSPPPVDMPNF